MFIGSIKFNNVALLQPLYMSASDHSSVYFRKHYYFTENINNVHCAECPADFTRVSSVNGCYKVVTRKLDWSAAGLQCRRLHRNAHLLVINDAQEQSAVAGMLASIGRQCYSVFFLTVACL